MSLDTAAFSGGFQNPVFDSQSVFNDLMNTFARPGTLAQVKVDVTAPDPLGAAQGAIALCLADHDTPVFLSDNLAVGAVPQWLAFHSGAPVTMVLHEARFAFLDSKTPLPDFADFAIGSQEYPDRSTTLVIEIASLDGGENLTLTGAGIKIESTISPAGLPEGFLEQWALNRALFPRGIDVVLTAGDQMISLPRTTRIGKKEL